MTTRANAAAATGLPADRRTLLSGAALASLVAATAAVPAIAAEQPGPIELAYSGWVQAARAADEACLATWQAEERYEEPERPRYLHFRSQGASDVEIVGINERGNRLGRYYLNLSDKNVADLKAMIAAPFDPSKSEPESVEWNRHSHQQKVEQAKETLRTIEGHRAECKRRADACGLTAAQDHERPLMEVLRTSRDAIFAMTPTTFREAAFQAEVISEDWDETAAGNLIEALAKLAGIVSYHREAA